MTANKKIVFLLLVLLIVINLLIIIALPDSPTRLLLSDVFYLILSVVVLLCLWFAARQTASVSRQLTACWWFLFSAHLFELVADVIWIFYELVLQTNPFPSIADLFYLARYPVFLAGIVRLFEKDNSTTRRVNTWLDAGLVFISSFLVLWITILSPLLESVAGQPLLEQDLNLAYPVGDLMLISALLILIYKRSSSSMTLPLALLSFSMLAEIVSDLLFGYQSLTGTYVSGGLTDIGWLVGYGFVGLAAYFQSEAQPSKKVPLPLKQKKNPAGRKLLVPLATFCLIF